MKRFKEKGQARLPKLCSGNSGQVLTEILVAISIIAIVIGGTAILMSSSLLSGKKIRQISTANSLALEMIESFEGVANNSWISIYCPPDGDCAVSTKGDGVEHSTVFSTSTNTWSIQSGSTTTTVDGIIYNRYFYIEDVDRDSSGAGSITTSTSEFIKDDPSTQKITAFVDWGLASSFQVIEYITRVNNVVFSDSKWSSSKKGDGPYTVSLGYSSTTAGDIIFSGDDITLSEDETPTTHSLISPIFDTGFANGVAFNFIKWKGTQVGNSKVKFQIASSTTTTSFVFKGTDGTDATKYESQADGSSIAPATIYTRFHNNDRYFRYKVFLEYGVASTDIPTIDEIIIGYSP